MRQLLVRTTTLVALAGATGLVLRAVLTLPAAQTDLADRVSRTLDQAGVDHPVTAVLLNFRAIDTLFEVAVLLVALLGAHGSARPRVMPLPRREPVLDAAAQFLIPLMLLTSVYLLWAGATRAGGAFQSASVAASAGVLLALAGMGPRSLQPGAVLRLGLVAGLALFLVIAVSTDGALLSLPRTGAKELILLIETGLAISLALSLWALFLCVAATRFQRPEGRKGPG